MLFRARERFAATFLVIALAGCATAGGALPPAPAPRPFDVGEAELAAELLALEQQGVFDEVTLAAAATSTHPRLRARAALAIARLGATAAMPLATALLEDGDSSVAATAAFALGRIGNPEAVPVLSRFVRLSAAAITPSVVSEAAAALGYYSIETSRVALREFLREAQVATRVPPTVVAEALLALARAGDTSAESYLPWLNADDSRVAWAAAFALTESRSAAAVRPLLATLEHVDPQVRAAVVGGLNRPLAEAAGLSSAEVLPPLLQAAADSIYAVRVEAIRSLASFSAPGAVAAVVSILGGGDAHAILTALEALGAGGAQSSDAVIRALQELVGSSNAAAPLRARALAVLTAITPDALPPIIPSLAGDSSSEVRAELAAAIGRARLDPLPLLAQLARDADPRVAAAALEALRLTLGSHSLAAVRSLLLELLQSPDAAVRAAALRSLGALADPITYPALLDAFETARADAREDAALAAIDAIADLGIAAGLAAERAFFTRFREPPRPDVHRHAIDRFGDSARRAWGDSVRETSTPSVLELVGSTGAALDATSEFTNPRVLIRTGVGDLHAELFPEFAPLTVADFLYRVDRGAFDGYEWSSISPNHVLEAGRAPGDSPSTRGYTVRDEWNRLRFGYGTLGMSTADDAFFVTLSPQPELEGAFAVFGRIVSGSEVLESLVPGARILSVRRVAEEE